MVVEVFVVTRGASSAIENRIFSVLVLFVFANKFSNGNCCQFLQRLPLNIQIFKAQQLVAIVVVLFFARCKLREIVQNTDNFGLDFKRFFGIVWAWDGDQKIISIGRCNLRHLHFAADILKVRLI